MKEHSPHHCACCGLEIAEGTAGCQRLFEALIARDFSDALFFRVHRMMVDTYALQHPDRYCASAKSLAAHLVGLYWILERQGDPAVGSEPIRRWLDGNRRLVKPEIPEFRGKLTVADVSNTETPTEYAEAVRRWAESTWSAYASLHAVAREWAREARMAQSRSGT